MKRQDLEYFLNNLLNPESFKDYGPNGLQVEGQDEITKVAFAVSATRASIEACIEEKAQALVVHHGLFWRFHGVRPLVGAFGRRVLPLVRAEINLFGYHLPLDANMEVGHAKCLAEALGLINLKPFGQHEGSPTGVQGQWDKARTDAELKVGLEKLLQHPVLHAQALDRPSSIKTVGIITGGANSDWKLAAHEGLDAYITGEMSEHDWHESAESGVSLFAGGHHATERLGVISLMERVKTELKLDCIFIDSDNPA